MDGNWTVVVMLVAGIALLIYAVQHVYILAKSDFPFNFGWLALLLLTSASLIGYCSLLLRFFNTGLSDSLIPPTATVLLLAALLVAIATRLCHATVQHSEQLLSEAHYDSLQDKLTGMQNRRGFLNDLQDHIDRDIEFALLLIDLSKFKQIDEKLARSLGDTRLKEIAERLKLHLEERQTIYRLGEQFAIIDGDPSKAEAAAQKLLQRMREPISLVDSSVETAVNVGLSKYPEHGDDTTALLSCADLAVHQARQNPQSFAWFQSDLNSKLQRKLAISTNLRQAMANNWLLLHYQPIFSNDGSGVHALEALLRWPVRDGVFIAAEEFIPIAEEERMVDAITNWVVLTAVRQLGIWLREGLNLNININLSALDLQDPNLWSRISDILRAEQVPAHRVVLEFTESAMVQDADRALKTLQQISAGGAQVALDDFGSDYACMASLRGMPINQIKLHRRFVHDVVYSPQDAAVVKATVSLAKSLDCSVTATGVATAQIASHLRALGCDHLQGYHFARPQAAEDIEALLRNFPEQPEVRWAS